MTTHRLFWVVEVGDAWLVVKKARYDIDQMVVVCVGGRTREEALRKIADIRDRRRLVG